MALLQAQSRMPGQRTLTLVNGATDTGYVLLAPPQWAAPSWDTRHAGPRGTQGSRAVGATALNRAISIPVRCDGATTDGMLALYSALAAKADEMRRYGGLITWRPEGGTYRVHFDVLAASTRLEDWDRKAQHLGILDVFLDAATGPFALGDPMDVADPFDFGSEDAYTIDTAGGGLSVTAGQLTPDGTGTVRWRRTREGYRYRDAQVTMRIVTGSTVTNWRAELCSAIDPDNADTHVYAAVTSGLLSVGVRVDDSATAIASTAVTVSASEQWWLRLRREGVHLTADLFSVEPSPMATPDETISGVMSAAEDARHPSGHCGFRLDVVSTAERYDGFEIAPYTYRNVTLPHLLQLGGLVPGDAPALCDLTVTPSGGSAAPIWALMGWTPAAGVRNRVVNGDFERNTNGWVASAVSGVTGAATSVARITTAGRVKYGSAALEIVTPATANTGGSHRIWERFELGRRYLALLWASAGSSTTNTRLRLGVSGDIASESAAALTTTPTLRQVVWQPAATVDSAYVAFEVTAATGTTMAVDGVQVFETLETTLAGSASAATTAITVTGTPVRLPEAPFVALINSELVSVDAVDGTSWTIGRAVDGTTAATHNASDTVWVLPSFSSHREGKGGPAAFGVIEGEQADNLYQLSVGTPSGTRAGSAIESGTLTGAGYASADWLVDPHLLAPDQYTQGELAVEVWARIGVNTNVATPRVILAAAPETATVSAGVFASSYGAVRYSDEYGSAGRTLVVPSTSSVFRLVKCGTVRLIVDRDRPQRWRLQTRLTWGSATATGYLSIDYLVLTPATARSASPTAKPNDATYPVFVASTSETIKTVAADLSGLVQQPSQAPHPDSGLGGSLLEMPTGHVDTVVKLSSLAADDPTSAPSSEQLAHNATVHFSLTPRWATARGS